MSIWLGARSRSRRVSCGSRGIGDSILQRIAGCAWCTALHLEIRGAGQILGAMQSGTTRDRGSPHVKDTELLTWAKEDAAPIISEDTRLARRPQLRAEIYAALGEEAAAWLTSA